MPRPTQIEYKGAFYHVMNRGRAHPDYAAYVSESVDEDILSYYNKGNNLSVLGGRSFREWIKDETQEKQACRPG